MIYGLIISAGNQSRFKNETPKALMPVNESRLLDLNIENLNKICDKVFTVVSDKNSEWFNGYDVITISSGLGCGDAVLKAINSIATTDDDYFIIQWGDCYISTNVLYKIKNYRLTEDILIPCEYVENPYTSIIEENNKLSVYFKKYNEIKDNFGYHDLSIFFAKANMLKKYMNHVHDKLYVDNSYKHKHGNEFTFLDVFNESDITGKILVCDERSYYFNTIDEFELFKKELNDIL